VTAEIRQLIVRMATLSAPRSRPGVQWRVSWDAGRDGRRGPAPHPAFPES